MRSQRKADAVADDLLRQIVSGSIQVGSLLPREKELSQQYGVNRSVIREAIKLLEVHRLVQPIRRRGTEVLNPLTSISPEVIRAMLTPAPGRIDYHVFSDLLEIRSQLDIQMSTLAAERHRDHDLEAFALCLETLKSSGDDQQAFSEGLQTMTLAIAEATQNRIFPMLVHWDRRVRSEIEELMSVIRKPSPALIQGIESLINFIAARDVETVRALVTSFHNWSRPTLLAEAARLSHNKPTLALQA